MNGFVEYAMGPLGVKIRLNNAKKNTYLAVVALVMISSNVLTADLTLKVKISSRNT